MSDGTWLALGAALALTVADFGKRGSAQRAALPLRAAHVYVSSRERTLTDAEAQVRQIAYALKDPWTNSAEVVTAGGHLAALVADIDDPVLVPVPSSDGSTAVNRVLAEAVAQHLGAPICDVLGRQGAVQSTLARHKRGVSRHDVADHRMTGRGLCDGTLLLIDNVASSGNTLRAARAALGDRGIGLVWAVVPALAGSRSLDLDALLAEAEMQVDAGPGLLPVGEPGAGTKPRWAQGWYKGGIWLREQLQAEPLNAMDAQMRSKVEEDVLRAASSGQLVTLLERNAWRIEPARITVARRLGDVASSKLNTALTTDQRAFWTGASAYGLKVIGAWTTEEGEIVAEAFRDQMDVEFFKAWKRRKAAAPKPFEVGDSLILHSPHVGEDTTVQYRGRVGDQATVIMPSGFQITISLAWLRHPGTDR